MLNKAAIRFIALYLCVVILTFGVSGCKAEVELVVNETQGENDIIDEVSVEYVPYEEIPDDYSLEDSKADGCVVFEDSRLTSGDAIWKEFLSKSQAGQSTEVRIVVYFTLNANRVSEEYYEEYKDEYPHLFVQDLNYDGERYHLYSIEDENVIEYEYPYLVKSTGEPRSNTALFSNYVCYILAYDPDVTYEEVMDGLLSSQSGAAIDAVIVYHEIID